MRPIDEIRTLAFLRLAAMIRLQYPDVAREIVATLDGWTATGEAGRAADDELRLLLGGRAAAHGGRHA